ncbi:hypothetical protein PMI18_00459 [Pseudomonas sp. GM102]|uniref:AAA family ATPase n=1 Tax=Pseudomonas sp. GM102 TaxID=1144321 RepID=UPI00026FBCDD|nr:AAA family ATPase [Pseudomonas sp. GM102]EJM07341.1 hypothetical protein PMI18_00459 [Pseudomonas sp. GM102]
MPSEYQDDNSYLPLSYETAEVLAGLVSPLDTASLERYSVAELAAALLIQKIPALSRANRSAAGVERSLAEMIEIGRQLEENQKSSFSGLVAQKFSPPLFGQGLDKLRSLSIQLLPKDDVEEADFLTAEGAWDFEFRHRYIIRSNPYTESFLTADEQEFFLTNPQSRIFQLFRFENDEHMNLQALAGTGKTHMIETLLASLSHWNPLVLAYTSVQLDALRARLGPALKHGKTFGSLAIDLLEQDRTKPNRQAGYRGKLSYQLSDEVAAERLGFQSVGNISPTRVAQICRRAVISFCNTNADEIGEEHFPPLDLSFSALDWAVLVQYANQHWQQTIEPTVSGINLPIRGYHRIKHLSLLPELVLSKFYTHVIVDESHDLSAPMLRFLDRCSQPTYTLGDVCQRLEGMAARRGGHIRQREVSLSVRAGKQIEEVLNPLIQAHPTASVAPLVGSRHRSTRVSYYDRPAVPDRPTTILVKSEWGLFEWFQRLSKGGAHFSLLAGAQKNFRDFVLSCIELYHFGTPPLHPKLFRFSSWESLAEFFEKNQAFRNIEAMLKKGYNSRDFERSLMSLEQNGAAPIQLGRVEDARNMELDSVMLTPDLLTPVKKNDVTSASRTFSALYTGGSRARFEVIVPGYLRDWALDQTIKK